MEGVARNYLKSKKNFFSKKLQVAYNNCYHDFCVMPNLAINCERLVPKSAWRFGRNAHESEAAEDNCWWSWIQTQRQILLNVHLVGPARGTSHRITPAQLLNRRRISSSSTNISSDLNRRRISSSSTYISSDLQQELFTESCQRSYWTDWGFYLHPYPRNGLSDNFPGFINHDS